MEKLRGKDSHKTYRRHIESSKMANTVTTLNSNA